jgi:IS30 family transposase
MNDDPTSVPTQTRFGELANRYSPKMGPKLKMLLPLKSHIEGLLAKRASYDDIRILLQEANIVVSKNTIYRFCRQVIGRPPMRNLAAEKKEVRKTLPVLSSPASTSASIQTALQERRERLPGPWGRRKPGPRIADSKNL